MTIRILTPVAKAKGRPSPASMEALADQMSGFVKIGFQTGITRFGARVNRDSMERAVRSGDYKDVVQTIPWDKLPQDLSSFGQSVGRAASAGTKFGKKEVQQTIRSRRNVSAKTLANLDIGANSPFVRKYIKTRTGDLVQNVTDGLQKTIQNALLNAKKGYLSPRAIADRLIDQQLPLNDRQALALDNFAESARQTLGPKMAEKAVSRYASQLQDQRAVMIAQTEASYATNAGQQQVWETAQEEGLIGKDAQKEWSTEANPCDICLRLNGQQVPIDEDFILDGQVVVCPAHPRCRCYVVLIQN